MKNNLINSMAFIALFMMVLHVPMESQNTEPQGKTSKKDKLEQRNQSGSRQSTDQINPNDPSYDQDRPHLGGKQNFERRNFNRGDFRHEGIRPRGFNRGGMYRRNFEMQHFKSYRFRAHRGFGGQGWRGQQFRRNGFHRPGSGQFKNNPGLKKDMKAFKDQIWKDGIMDLKERELLRNKVREFKSGQPQPFDRMKRERIRDL